MTAPTTTDELTEALARAETVEAVSNIHNTVRRGGLFGADELWAACSARWAEIEQGMTRERMLDS